MHNHPDSYHPERCPIAIIGGGFSGVLVAIHLLRMATEPLLIKLIESHSELGRGVAYHEKLLDCHLLNVPAGKMGAFPDLPGDFLDWLHQHGYPQALATSFIPRRIYGDYIQDIFQTALTEAAPGVRLEYINDRALKIDTETDQVNIFLEHDRQIQAEKLVLAWGNFPPAVPQVIGQMKNYENYLVSGWSVQAIANISWTDSLLIVGTGLTMVDVVVTLTENNFQGKIYAISRHGLTPQRHAVPSSHHQFIEPQKAPRHINNLLKTVRQEVSKADYHGADWRGVVDVLRPVTSLLWQELPLVEKQRFLRHLGAYWEIHRHRIAPEIANILDEMLVSGQLTIIAGRIEKTETLADQVNVTVKERRSQKEVNLLVDRIINCTGSNCHYQDLDNPLINDLIKQGLIAIHATGIGIHTASNGAILNSDGQPSQQLYTLGTPRKGDLWESTAVPEIRVQAHQLAIELLAS